MPHFLSSLLEAKKAQTPLETRTLQRVLSFWNNRYLVSDIWQNICLQLGAFEVSECGLNNMCYQ